MGCGAYKYRNPQAASKKELPKHKIKYGTNINKTRIRLMNEILEVPAECETSSMILS